ncbi:MAG: preprotein translocase subunit SecG [Clostridia bacterium]|nr:preprotein translocase subunit SecG [Clostridia bacterium]
MEIAVGIVLIVIALFLIIAVLFQSSKNARLSGAIAGSAETFFGKAKGKSIDKKLNTLTVIVSIIFAVAVLVVYAIQPGKAKIDYNYDYLESYIDGVVDGSIDISVSEDEEEGDEHDHDHDHDHESEDDSSADAEK